MESLPTILQRKLDEGAIDPAELGRAVARAVPRNWKVSVYAVVKAGIPKSVWKTLFHAFFEEQRRKAPKFKRRSTKKDVVEEEDDGPEQLDLLD